MFNASGNYICTGTSGKFTAFSPDGAPKAMPKLSDDSFPGDCQQRPGPNYVFEVSPAAWGFAFRTGLAACLGLYVAFFMQMEDPYWASISAMIVSNPNYGQILHRGVFRIVGSFVGFLVALLFAATFAQEPMFFLVSLALWVGGCVTLARMLPDAQAFGVAGAGFTTAIITLAVISDQPLSVFTTAIERFGDIVVGIGAAILVSGILRPYGAVASMEQKVDAVLREAVRLLCIESHGNRFVEFTDQQKTITDEIFRLRGLVAFAAVEDTRARQQRRGLTAISASLFNVAQAAGNIAYIRDHMSMRERDNPVLCEVFSEISLLNKVVDHPGSLSSATVVSVQHRLLELEQEAFNRQIENVQAIIHQIQEGLKSVQIAVRQWLDWKAGRTLNASGSTEYHRNGYDALLNGARCFIAILSSSFFWIFTQWPNGPGLVTIVSIVSCFVLIQDDPRSFSMFFLWGVVWLVPAGFIYSFLILPQSSDFVPLAVATMFFVVPGGLAASSLDSQTSVMGRAYMVLFFSVTTVRDPMVFDLSKYLNNALSTVGGVGFVALSAYLIRSFAQGQGEPRSRPMPVKTLRINSTCLEAIKGASS